MKCTHKGELTVLSKIVDGIEEVWLKCNICGATWQDDCVKCPIKFAELEGLAAQCSACGV